MEKTKKKYWVYDDQALGQAQILTDVNIYIISPALALRLGR